MYVCMCVYACVRPCTVHVCVLYVCAFVLMCTSCVLYVYVCVCLSVHPPVQYVQKVSGCGHSWKLYICVNTSWHRV